MHDDFEMMIHLFLFLPFFVRAGASDSTDQFEELRKKTMGDAADILGIKKEDKGTTLESAIGGTSASSKRKQRVNSKPPNVSREVYALLNGQTNSGLD